jgi:hypothetical protein
MRLALNLRRCDSGYETLDGRYVIERQDDYSECEHPMCDPLHKRFWAPGRGVLHPINAVQWHVWDNHAYDGRGDYVDPSHSRGFTTKRDATRWLKDHLAETYRDAPDKLDLYLAGMM